MDSPQGPSKEQKKLKPYNTYLKYSGLGLQLLATIAVSGWLGHLVDQYLRLKYPVFMILFGFAGFGGIMYQLYKSISK